jgi:hypothetical protein
MPSILTPMNSMKKPGLFTKFCILVVMPLSLFFILYLIPKISETKLKEKSPGFLKMNGYTIIKDNGYSMLYNQEEFIVKRDSIVDTIEVKLNRGSLILQPK